MEEIKRLSVEDLMKPRYKIIADYPGNDNEVGSVFTYRYKKRDRFITLNK